MYVNKQVEYRRVLPICQTEHFGPLGSLFLFFFMARGGNVKVPTLERGGLFKDYDLHKVLSLDVPLAEIEALSLNYFFR